MLSDNEYRPELIQSLEEYLSKKLKDAPDSDLLSTEAQNTPPEKLYRYRPLNNLNNIKNEIEGNIYLSHKRQLDDPYDLSTTLSSNTLSYYFQELKEFYKIIMQEVLTKDEIDSIFKEEYWFESLLKVTFQKSTLVDTEDEEIEEQTRQMLHYMIEQLESINNEYRNTLENLFRVACFTTSKYNTAMWEYYAGKKTGVCLEYSTSQIDPFMKYHLHQVSYVTREQLPDLIKIASEHKFRALPNIVKYALTCKVDDWAWQKEWRLIMDAGCFYRSLNDTPETFWKNGKLISFCKPSKIFLGTEISPENKDYITQLASKHNIPVLQMKFTNHGLQY